MSKQKSGSIRASFIDKGLKEANHIPELSRELLNIFSSLEKFQKEIQDCKGRDEALAKMLQFVDGWNMFHATAFYVVNEENLFDLALPSDTDLAPEFDTFIKQQIREGRFAWALQQNREILVDSPENLPGEQAILHGMSTRQTTLGMFVGFLKYGHSNVRTTLFRILSIMIDAVVYVYENHCLQSELTEYNQRLEKIVESRTRELRHANQHLDQSNTELKKVNEKKSEFLGIVAHDLKNPLSGIIGFAELLTYSVKEVNKNSDAERDMAIELIGHIQQTANHMVMVLNDLMDSEIIESGNLKLDPVKVDLAQLAQKVVIINQTQADSKKIRIHFQTEDDITVYADALRIHEAIDNLVSNAIKYSPLDREVWVNVRKDMLNTNTPKAVFSIKDEGPGLTDDDKSKLFGRFQKLSARPSAGESSTGLGLSIVKNLITLHNGEVWVNSEEGKGAEFCFSLPLENS